MHIIGGTIGGVCSVFLAINGVWLWLWYRRRARPLHGTDPLKTRNADEELDSKHCAPKIELAENPRPHEADGMVKYELYGSNRGSPF